MIANLTEDQNKSWRKIIFVCQTGSRAYGTDLPTSDYDFKGVYVQHPDHILSFGHKQQIDIGKNICLYEIRRFLQLASTANPTILEMLYSPLCDGLNRTMQECKAWDLVHSVREKFLTKKCVQSFGGYAVQQIQKARGLDKKMNYEKERVERKTPFYFCHVIQEGKTVPLEKFLKQQNLKPELCGLAALDHFRDCYALYYDYPTHYGPTNRTSPDSYNFRGICIDEGNSIRLSDIPKGLKPLAVISYNKDSYTMHCKDYNEYQTWLTNRNTERYVDTQVHGQKIDGKNIMHCRRLLDMAAEIAITGTLQVRRPNAEQLLEIRKGEVKLKEVIDQAELDVKALDQLYANSSLPGDVDFDFLTALLLNVRKCIQW